MWEGGLVGCYVKQVHWPPTSQEPAQIETTSGSFLLASISLSIMAPLSSTNPSQVPADPILYTFPTKDALSKSLAEFVIKVRVHPILRVTIETVV